MRKESIIKEYQFDTRRIEAEDISFLNMIFERFKITHRASDILYGQVTICNCIDDTYLCEFSDNNSLVIRTKESFFYYKIKQGSFIMRVFMDGESIDKITIKCQGMPKFILAA